MPESGHSNLARKTVSLGCPAYPNRINIDTGEARPKTLTAVALEGAKPPRFMSVS